MTTLFQQYESAMTGARERFDQGYGLRFMLSLKAEPNELEFCLIHFCALGVRMTEPVEGWIRRAGDRCESIGLADLARSLRGHAKAESGHHLMMIADVKKLTERWNARHTTPLRADELLSSPPSLGADAYIAVHENNITGPTPFAQLAIEYEIEMLPLRYGERLVKNCMSILGAEILGCLGFVTEHLELCPGSA